MFTISQATPSMIRNRQIIFWGVCSVLMILGTLPMAYWTINQSFKLTAALVFLLFIVLLSQLAYGFTMAVTGHILLRRGGDHARINNTLPPGIFKDKLASTAIVIPIFNEDPSRVFQGIKVMYESLQKTGAGDAFDFFILSDSNNPNNWIAEEKAWLELCKQTEGFGRIFYRKRRIALHNKSGNIADFCRRWGSLFRYMIVLDADSIITGTALVRLVNLMEQNPRVGIIQTDSKAVLGKTLYQRIIQFAIDVYGPSFKAGANFWQLGSGNFWGHNAIIRLRPFMKHCAIPELDASSPLGRRILSHDTVEAALMRRSGYTVWFAYDLEGSYEENPPHLLLDLKRAQRWCFGNLQHIWLLHEPGIKPQNRIHIINGIMSYTNALLWFLFLLLNTMLALASDTTPSSSEPISNCCGGALLGYVLVLLFLPKVLATNFYLSKNQIPVSSSKLKIIGSVLGETLFSFLLAPILMFFYTRFVCAAFLGSMVTWGAQKRNDDEIPSWSDGLAAFGSMICMILLWAAIIAWINPGYLSWMSLVFIGPVFSIFFTRYTACAQRGERARKNGWFLTAEEISTPEDLREVESPFIVPAPPFFQAKDYAQDYGLMQVLLDPYINSIHVSLLRQRRQVSPKHREYINTLGERLLLDGPHSLGPREKRAILWDAECILTSHRRLWSTPAAHLHSWWQAAFRHYNEASVLVTRRSLNVI
ncbi:MAG TPA: glucans biosynthesis glucosyltransferase MdoH [Verrucomicrobiae bacterium]